MASIVKEAKWIDETSGLVCQVKLISLSRDAAWLAKSISFGDVGNVGGGHWCGYVLLPKGHPWHGKDYNDLLSVEVHGGLTYSDKDGDHWKIGFDCAHAGDGWQDESWVRGECAALAAQCRAQVPA